MVCIAVGSILLFTLLHNSAFYLTTQLTVINPQHQSQIKQYARQASNFYARHQLSELDQHFATINLEHQAWSGLIPTNKKLLSHKSLPSHLQDVIGFQRQVQWPVHDFMQQVMIGIKVPAGYFVMELPQTMRPRPNVTLIEILITIILPSILLSLFCWGLYRHLMRPLNALKDSSIRLAGGDLSTRVCPKIADKEDSIAQVATSFNQMASRIEQLVGYQRQFLRDLSHELRTPLTRLELALDLCNESNTQTIDLGPRFKRDIEQMKSLVEDTLSLAWLETDPAIKCEDNFNLATLINLICEDADFEFPQRAIVRQYCANLPIENTNQRALAQSIENILRNALKYSSIDTKVTIKCFPYNTSHYQLEIIDQGIGVSSPDLCKIFEPFFRSDKARSREAGGFGLGLALTKRQIAVLGGKISAHNNTTKGLVIKILLPINLKIVQKTII